MEINLSAYLQQGLALVQRYSAELLAWFKLPESYVQMALVAVCYALAIMLAKLIRTKFSALQEPASHVPSYSWRWVIGRAGRLFYPLLLLSFLTLTEAFVTTAAESFNLISAVLRVAVVWLLWVILKAFVLNPIVRSVALWILVPAALLRLFNILQPVIDYLSQYGFTVGEVNITLYTVVKAVFFISVVLWIGRLISQSMSGYIMKSPSLTRSTKELLIKLFDIVLYTVLFMATLRLLGIDLTALAVFSGALGVGLGFGLQKIASNFISGIILLSEKSININNLVEMDDGVLGYVRKLGARASVIETFDGKEVMVPNEDFITSRVANLTHSNNKGRVDIFIGVSYASDLDLVFELIEQAATEYDQASTDEPHQPQVYLREFGDSSVNFLLTFWLDDVSAGRWRAKSDVMHTVWRKFKENNIEIPFPQRDLHLRSPLPMPLTQQEWKERQGDDE